MLTALLIIFALAFAALAWKKLDWAVLATVALLPAYVVRATLVLPTTALEIMILIVFAVWFIRNRQFLLGQLKDSRRVQPYPFRWPLAVWIFISFFAVIIAGSSIGALGLWRAYFLEPMLLFIVAFNVFNTKDKLVSVIAAFGCSAAAVSLVAAYQYFTGDLIANPFWAAAESRRATSVFPYPNAVGLYLGPIILFLSGLFMMLWLRGKSLFKRRWKLLLTFAAIVLSLTALFFARSDGALFAVAACLVIFALFSEKRIRLAAIALIIAGVIAIIATPSLNSYVGERLALRDFSGQVRRLQWRETLKMLTDNRLITGAGLGRYQAAVAPFHQEGFFYNADNDPEFVKKVTEDKAYRDAHWQPLETYLYPHNLILNFWSELGLAGVLAFAWLAISFFYAGIRAYIRARRNNDSFAYVILGLMLALLVMIIHGTVDVPYFKNDLAAMFWIMFAMMGVISLNVIPEKAGTQS